MIKKKLDNIFVGLVIGLVAPFIVMYCIFYGGEILHNWYDFGAFYRNHKFTGLTLRPSLIVNLVFIVPYTKRPRMQFLKGIILATLLYAVVIVTIHLI